MGNTETHGQKEFPPTDVLQDEVFFSALLRSAADVDVSVDIGGVVQDGKWKNKPHGPIGLYHGSVPFDGNTGEVVVTVSRRGEKVAEMRGASISESCLDDIQNWNAWVGTNFANNTISRHPPPSPAPTAVSAASTLLALGRIPLMIVFVALVASMVAATATPVRHETLVLTGPISEVSPSVYSPDTGGDDSRSLYSYGTRYGLYPINGYTFTTTTTAPVTPFISTGATSFAYDTSWNLYWS